jgi:hypothetical protein
MTWIESHSNLARHPKTRRLMKLLGWSLPDTIGNLHLLWWWAQDFAPTGDLSHFSAEDLTADLDLCGATPEQFVEAMVAAGFLDRIEQTLCIHDWVDYQRPNSCRKSAGSSRRAEAKRETKVSPPDIQATPSTPLGSPVPPVREQEPVASRVTPVNSTISGGEPPAPATHSESSSNASPVNALPGQESHSANAKDDSSPVIPSGRESQIPHLLDEQPGFTDIWWPKFLDIHEANGTPLTRDARCEHLASLARNPFSAVELLRALINEAANAITASAPEETLTRHTSSRRNNVGVAPPVPNTS